MAQMPTHSAVHTTQATHVDHGVLGALNGFAGLPVKLVAGSNACIAQDEGASFRHIEAWHHIPWSPW